MLNTKNLTWDDVYPVGSIYMSVNAVNPSNLFGGEWEQIQDTFLVAAGTTYAQGDTGGSDTFTPTGTIAEHILTTAEVPAHTHTRGTMEITGSLNYNKTYSGTQYSNGYLTGAFYARAISGQQYYLSGRSTGSGWCDVDFAASRAWTGETSSVGGNGGHAHNFVGTTQTNLPPYLAVYMWQRVA